jgi:NAD+ kinase
VKKQTIGIIVNPRKESIESLLADFDSSITKYSNKISFLLCTFHSPYIKKTFKYLITTNETTLLKKSELIITLGGDGTLLRTVTKLKDDHKKIMGVNLGGLGFLADTPPKELKNHVENYIEGNYILDERMLLTSKINGSKEKFYALNDIVIDKAGFSRVIQIDTRINGTILNSYIADGLIISTPTGSTGYSLSAGGPIVTPHTNVLVLNPICPHSLSNRPVIISDNYEVSLRVWTESDSFNVLKDGQNQGSYPSGTRITIKKSLKNIAFVKMKSQNFFNTLSTKLNWGEDFRNKKRWTYQKNNKD